MGAPASSALRQVLLKRIEERTVLWRDWLVKKQVLTVAVAVTLGAVGMAFGRTLVSNVANDTERSVICRCDRNCNCDRQCRPIDGCR